MVIEDFEPELVYIPGPTNVVTDNLIILDNDKDIKENKINNDTFTGKLLEQTNIFAGNNLSDNIYLLNFKLI